MTATVKQKLCWNCEGNVSREIENCPYCGVYLSPETSSDKNSILAPPYTVPKAESKVPEAPYGTTTVQAQIENDQEESFSELSNVMVPLMLLLPGSIFLLFGLVLFLFATDGILTLKWSADYWYLYFAVGLPMIFFGWRALSRLSSDSNT